MNIINFNDYLRRIGAHTDINRASERSKKLMMLGLYLDYYESVHNILVIAFPKSYIVDTFKTGTLITIIEKDFPDAAHISDRYYQSFTDINKYLKDNGYTDSPPF